MNITLEQLAEKLNGNLWEKGNLRRIYLDRGYNTRKMSTKTFVWQDENGDFKVSCRIDCPSQAGEWIRSQENEVKESVYNAIESALSDTVYILTDDEGRMVDWQEKEIALNNCSYELTEKAARREIDNCTYFSKFITMPRSEFEKEVERLDKIEEEEKVRIASQNPESVPNTIYVSVPEKTVNTDTPDFGVGVKVVHSKFGTGLVTAESDKIIEIDFETAGHKQLLKEFAKLQKAES